jgi:hypothetical protein
MRREQVKWSDIELVVLTKDARREPHHPGSIRLET